jgi:DNA invertase Pin-like site-specific DNA recombinase
MRTLFWPCATRGYSSLVATCPTPIPLRCAVIAQHERETTSQRTKDALQAKKARGAQLGTPANLTEQVRQVGLVTRQRNAREHGGIRQVTALILARRAQGLICEKIAGELNALGFTARRGGPFSQKQVQRLVDRMRASLPAA